MDTDFIIRIVQEALLLTLLLSAPPVATALVIGLLLSVLQAATQIQEQNLTQVPKIVAVYATLIFAGLWILGQLIAFASALFEVIPRVS